MDPTLFVLYLECYPKKDPTHKSRISPFSKVFSLTKCLSRSITWTGIGESGDRGESRKWLSM